MIKIIKVNDNEIILNDIVIGNPVAVEEIEGLFNKKPSRIVQNINTIFIYDDDGVYFYTSKKIGSQISQIDIQMEIQSWLTFAPYSKFSGKIYINEKEIQNLNDLLSLGYDVLNTDELDGDGSIKVYLSQVGLDISVNTETKMLQNISIWYL